jgi:hypothetical protein
MFVIAEIRMSFYSNNCKTIVVNFICLVQMFDSTGWILEEPAVEDCSKYDQMFPTVVQPPRPDILLSTQSAETEVSIKNTVLLKLNFNLNYT